MYITLGLPTDIQIIMHVLIKLPRSHLQMTIILASAQSTNLVLHKINLYELLAVNLNFLSLKSSRISN